jgi:hypothetical protein
MKKIDEYKLGHNKVKVVYDEEGETICYITVGGGRHKNPGMSCLPIEETDYNKSDF